MDSTREFLYIKYEGERFLSGRLPLDVLADFQALESILITFAHEIWLKENNRDRMPKGHADWFRMSLTGVDRGSALPKLELDIVEDGRRSLFVEDTKRELMKKAKDRLAEVLKAASDGSEVTLSGDQIKNFNRLLKNLKPGEIFKYTTDSNDDFSDPYKVVSLDVERRKRFLERIAPTYKKRIQGYARLKSVDERGELKFSSAEFGEFSVSDKSREPREYGANIKACYEFDLTVERRHDDGIHSVIAIHDLSLIEDPVITAIDEMAVLRDGWLDGYGKAVSSATRENARKFLISSNGSPEFYAVAPTVDGGILLEYEHDGWDYGVEFNPDGTFCVFGIDLNGSDEFSDTFNSDKFNLFLSKVKETIDQQ